MRFSDNECAQCRAPLIAGVNSDFCSWDCEEEYYMLKEAAEFTWYRKRVLELEDEGLTTSDAQAIADVEHYHKYGWYPLQDV